MAAEMTVSEPVGGVADPSTRSVGVNNPWWRRRGLPLFCLILVAIGFLTTGWVEAWRDSPTYDEPVYVSAGVLALTHHDLTYNEEHPPLGKVISAIPVLFTHPVIPKDGAWNTNNERLYSARFLRAQIRAGTLHRVTVASRSVPLLEVVAVGFVLFALARRLFGPWAGFLAGALWLLSPLVLGLGHLNGVDVPFALATSLFSLALLNWLRRRDRRSTIWLGLACLLVASAEITGLLLVGFAGVVVVGVRWRALRWRSFIPALQIGLITLIGLWVIYLALEPSLLAHPGVILPMPYVEGIRYLFDNDTQTAPGFLLGVSWTGGKWWYWPGSVLVKVTTPTLVALIVGPFFWRGHSRTTKRQAFVVLVVPALILFAVTVTSPRDEGIRYLMPEIALWMVAASPLVRIAHHVVGRVVLVGGAALAVFMMALSIPNSLAYTSPPFQPGYQVATNSSVDWGQDFHLLTTWSPGHHPYVAYFGPRGLIGAVDVPEGRPLLGVKPTSIRGWVAASATNLTSARRNRLDWLRAYCPVGELGGTILLYHFATPPTAAPGTATPAALCPGTDSHRVTSLEK